MCRGLRPNIPDYTPKALSELMRTCWAPVPQQRPTFKEVVVRLTDMYRDMCNS